MITFEWDKDKYRSNKKKHKVSFEEAETVFYDDNARLIPDPDHSEGEDRFIPLGMSNKMRMLIIVHTYRESDEIIRIISARKATRNEAKFYERKK
ncbi:MAG TPA: BrnT family toxin [Thermodesulfobacteriota bacterium]|nr:BrnT family toxin [Thermodesulfobacteriota bacterium]